MTVKNVTLPFDPIAFCLALIGAPIIFTLLTFYLLIPIVALFFGLPFYLAIGTPVLLWMVGRYHPSFLTYAFAGLMVNIGLFFIVRLAEATAVISSHTSELFVFGLIFGPLWAGLFAVLYHWLHRPLIPLSTTS